MYFQLIIIIPKKSKKFKFQVFFLVLTAKEIEK